MFVDRAMFCVILVCIETILITDAWRPSFCLYCLHRNNRTGKTESRRRYPIQTEFEAFEIAMLIKEIYSIVMRKVGSSLMDRSLTHQQIMIIQLLAHNQNKEINISDLCREMALTKGTVSGIVQRLEVAGYVEKRKHKDDKRITYVVFSEKGRAFAKEFRETINDSFQAVFKDFAAAELESTRENLRILRNKIKD